MYGNENLIKAYNAGAQIAPYLIVKFTANEDEVTPAAAATDLLLGVSAPTITVPITQRVDVVHEGIAQVKLGGVVVRGNEITSDATGQGIAAAPGVGVNNRIIGIALKSGVAGDVIPVLISLGIKQG